MTSRQTPVSKSIFEAFLVVGKKSSDINRSSEPVDMYMSLFLLKMPITNIKKIKEKELKKSPPTYFSIFYFY